MATSGLKVEEVAAADGALLEAELRSVLDAVPAGVLLLSGTGQIRFTNARFAQLFGLDFRTVSGVEEYERWLLF